MQYEMQYGYFERACSSIDYRLLAPAQRRPGNVAELSGILDVIIIIIIIKYRKLRHEPVIGLALKNRCSSDNPVILAIERYWMTSCKSRL